MAKAAEMVGETTACGAPAGLTGWPELGCPGEPLQKAEHCPVTACCLWQGWTPGSLGLPVLVLGW